MEKYNLLCEIIEAANSENTVISKVVIKQQAQAMEISQEEIIAKMTECYRVMEDAIAEGINKDLRSISGLTGGDAYKINEYNNTGKSLCGGIVGDAITYAVGVAEYNAAMGKIVAAPTAGACGVVPGVIFSLKKHRNYSEEKCVDALFTASAVGMVIANVASISGAEGGCQAEIGTASAMAAAAAVELAGGTPEQVGYAVAIAASNMMGLVCDPVAGLVEIPCIKRNAAGATNALTAADIALSGVRSIIPVDEVISVMKAVGDAMSPTLRETAEGGLAATPTGKRLFTQVFGNKQAQDCSNCTR